MGDIKTNLFIKNEFSKAFSSANVSNYTGLGVKVQKDNIGTMEPFIAFKASNTTTSTFSEFKYTSPNIANTNFKLESRTRFIADKSNGSKDLKFSANQRIAGKYANQINKNVGFYEIFGGNANIQNGKITKFTPTSITGLDFKLSNNLSMYTEVELTKSYNFENNKWDNMNSGGYLGLKYTF